MVRGGGRGGQVGTGTSCHVEIGVRFVLVDKMAVCQRDVLRLVAYFDQVVAGRAERHLGRGVVFVELDVSIVVVFRQLDVGNGGGGEHLRSGAHVDVVGGR